MRTYDLDPQSASSAGVSNYITETGKYKGCFTRAEIVTSRNDTEGVELSFVADDGRRSDFLQLWTYNARGEALVSLKVLNAIMACLRVRSIKPGQIAVQSDGGAKTVSGFPDLMGKPIGLLLQREEYESTKTDDHGNRLIRFRFNIVAPFEAATELTAGEILAKQTKPEQLARIFAGLKDKPASTAKATSGPRQNGGNASGGDWYGSENPAPPDDDIPFDNPYRGRVSLAV